jgi:predicted PhzF superfamily epimerase YddE/YHI9
MDFPSRPPEQAAIEADLVPALGVKPEIILKSRDYLVVYQSEQQVRDLHPDFMRLSGLECLGVIVTAPGDSTDFVSRFFAPGAGIPEDPVTGSAHCTLIPYWSKRLGKTKLHARQLSSRGGELFCEQHGDRVNIAGKAALYLIGKIAV